MLLAQRKLGRTGLSVSRLGFGGAVMGIPGYLASGDRDAAEFKQDAVNALRRAAELGVTLFDTAPAYGEGRSERFVGEALAPRRDHVAIATKLLVKPGQDTSEWADSLEASLGRLRTNRVEILQLHGSTWTADEVDFVLEDVVPWLAQVKAAGLARYTGITAETPSGALERLICSGHFNTLQVAYNVIYQSVCDYQRQPVGVVPLARSRGMGVLSMRTTTSGVLTKLLHTEFPELDPVRITRLSINFVLSTPEVDCALVGMTRQSEVEANVALVLDEASRLDLREVHNRFL